MGKCGRCVRLTTLPPSCAVVMKSGNLNFVEPSGPLQACNGTALSFIAICFEFINTDVLRNVSKREEGGSWLVRRSTNRCHATTTVNSFPLIV